MSGPIVQYFANSGGESAPVIIGETVDIYTGGTEYTDNDSTRPPSVGLQYWRYSATHYVVRASEINALRSGAKIITEVDVRFASTSGLNTDADYSAKNIGIFLAHTDELFTNSNMTTNMSQSTTLFDFSDRIRVKNKGDLSLLSADWHTINFDTNFEYNGTDNLVFSFYNEGVTSYTSGRRTTFAYGNNNSTRSATYGSDSGSNPATNSYSMTALGSSQSYWQMNLKINY